MSVRGQGMQEAGYEWRAGDVDWNSTTTLTYPAICSLAGLIAGMFGVGGGIVKGPLMLELGGAPLSPPFPYLLMNMCSNVAK